MKDIPADSLIKNYFPVDYIDSFSKVMVTGQALTPEDFRNLAFSRFPKWIGWLMNFRNAIVKPLGLDTATRFTDMVLDKNLHEEILGMLDKHLDFHVSMWCGEYHEGKQELRITTVVKYNNWLGRAYFFIIRPFHGIIVKSILKHVAGDRGSGSIYLSGATRNRTGDTRIFSPLLYQLSYGTMFISFAVAKVVKLLDYAIAFIIKNADNWLYG